MCVCMCLTGIQNNATASLCSDKCLCGQLDVRRFMPNHAMASLWRLMNARALQVCIMISLGPKPSIHFHRNVETFI